MPMPHFIARIVTIGGILAVIAGLVLVSCTAARARDLDGRYANSDPATREFFRSQTNRNGVNCCDESDGKRVNDAEWRTSATGYEVLINGKWVAVPDHAVLDGRTARPPGLAGAIVWIWPGTENSASPIVTCFLPGAGI